MEDYLAMPRAAAQLHVAALALLCGCAGTAGASLRVHPPARVPEDTAEAERQRVEEAVRDVGAMGRLECRPSQHPAPAILDCWPAAAPKSPAFVSLHLDAAPDGYEVTILESFGRSGPRVLCRIQDRLTERLRFRLGGGVVERDPRVTCRKNGSDTPDPPGDR